MLKIPIVSVRQNFFGLGGHSLLAIEILCQLRKQFSVGLSINDFFTKPTVAQQAALVSERLAGDGCNGEISVPARPAQASTLSPRVERRSKPFCSRDGMTLDEGGMIPPRDRSSVCPLSPAQERVWFLELLHPGQRAYNDGEAVRLHGKLDSSLMEEALNVLVERHEVLRTLIQVVDGRPVQVVHDTWPLRLLTIDLSSRPVQEREAEVERLLVEEPRRAYILSAEPGIRATLIRLTPEDHVLIVMLHHIVCDGWSLGILYKELGEIYRALYRHQPHHLPPPPLQYGDYATWQQQKVLRRRVRRRKRPSGKSICRGYPIPWSYRPNGPRPEKFTYEGEEANLPPRARGLGTRFADSAGAKGSVSS